MCFSNSNHPNFSYFGTFLGKEHVFETKKMHFQRFTVYHTFVTNKIKKIVTYSFGYCKVNTTFEKG